MVKHAQTFLLALLLLLPLAGCGGQKADYDPAKIAAQVVDSIDFSHELTLAEGAALENLYALDDSVVSYAVYYDAGSFSAEEVAVLKAKNAADASKLQALLDARLENLAFIFESYNPNEMKKINNPAIFVKENIAVMVLSDDAGAYDKVAALFK